ncbi:MAG: alpha-hydroxy-acid oxidizing protein [Gemmatimonadetes bacterium]|nr:alpha-hydroxy-acid oxidizing protein [Gemmatimonadota bacterium]
MLINLRDFEQAAAERLSQMAYDYYASGSDDERTLRDSELAYGRIRLRPRVLVDVSRRSTECTVLGRRVAFPVLVAPTAFQRMAHPDGELATARAAAALGTVMTVSTWATATLEEVRDAAGAGAGLWSQLYVYRDRGITRALVERAEEAGYEALVLTVDTPLLGRRERDIRNGFTLPAGLTLANLATLGGDHLPQREGESGLAAYVRDLVDPSLTWKDVDWLRSVTRLPVVIKGVVRGDDAQRAVDHGAAAIVVSNHGGRQLDTTVSSVDALPEVVAAVAERAEVYVDGGVRRGTDVLKALALGARAVFVGRPVLWGLAVGGEAGVTQVLAALRDEFDLAMALAGCASPGDVSRDLVER